MRTSFLQTKDKRGRKQPALLMSLIHTSEDSHLFNASSKGNSRATKSISGSLYQYEQDRFAACVCAALRIPADTTLRAQWFNTIMPFTTAIERKHSLTFYYLH